MNFYLLLKYIELRVILKYSILNKQTFSAFVTAKVN